MRWRPSGALARWIVDEVKTEPNTLTLEAVVLACARAGAGQSPVHAELGGHTIRTTAYGLGQGGVTWSRVSATARSFIHSDDSRWFVRL